MGWEQTDHDQFLWPDEEYMLQVKLTEEGIVIDVFDYMGMELLGTKAMTALEWIHQVLT